MVQIPQLDDEVRIFLDAPVNEHFQAFFRVRLQIRVNIRNNAQGDFSRIPLFQSLSPG